MNRAARIALTVGIIATLVGGFYWLLKDVQFDLLQPGGHIARRERDLLLFALSLCAVVVIPVFMMLFFFSWRYRDTNKSRKKVIYKPEWADNTWLEVVWWGIPVLIIAILATVTWITTKELDPYRKLDPAVSSAEPVEVQVIALEWKWLFIYPEQGVASAGRLMIPEKTPINFTITSDAPMNSFWIPNLGGQIYAMSAMSTKLSLIADKPGDYRGYSANISGEGFAGMKFIARAVSDAEFTDWVEKTKQQPALDVASYEKLAKPAVLDRPLYYSLGDAKLYDKMVDKYMMSDVKFEQEYGEPKSTIRGDDSSIKDMKHATEGARR